MAQEKVKVQHVLNWKENPDSSTLTLQSYTTLMKGAGEVCRQAQEAVAGVKGALAARKARAKS